jgi:hypothetical protein
MARVAGRTQAWMEMMRQHYANMGKQSRSVASNVYPHLNTNPMNRAPNPRPQGSAAARLYPHLPQQSAARIAPKAKPRATRARIIYGDEY